MILSVIRLLFKLPKRSVALKFCPAQSLPGSNTKFEFGSDKVQVWFAPSDEKRFDVGLPLVWYIGSTVVWTRFIPGLTM